MPKRLAQAMRRHSAKIDGECFLSQLLLQRLGTIVSPACANNDSFLEPSANPTKGGRSLALSAILEILNGQVRKEPVWDQTLISVKTRAVNWKCPDNAVR
jgi:hypothetical protein